MRSLTVTTLAAALTLALLLPTSYSLAQTAPRTPVTNWLLAHSCTTSIWNVSITPYVTGHGIFHPDIALTQTYSQERYGQTGRINGSAAGGEWCTGTATVGDNTSLGCWLANAGVPVGYVTVQQDQQDLGYVACAGTTACNYIRTNLGGEAACSGGGTTPPPPADHCNAPGATCHPACATCPSCPSCPPPPPCPKCPDLAAVPQDVRDTINAAPGWVTGGQKRQLNRVKAWLALVESYKSKISSTGANVLVVTP